MTREHPGQESWTPTEYALATAVMCLMGGFYWALRGTGGYGGEAGALIAGCGWATVWYTFSHWGNGAARRPYGSPWILLAISLGIALGGLTGYGAYMPWLSGTFHLNYPNDPRPISPVWGYAALFICGLHWGGNAGCAMAWCAPSRPISKRGWAARIACGVAGAVAAAVFVRLCPQLFLPFYREGIYAVPEYKSAQRTLGSLHTIAPHVGLFLGFLCFEVLRRDWRAVGMILTLAFGFAIPFCAGGVWQTMYDSPLKLSWWKNWEMTIGLGGGLALGLAFCVFNRPTDPPRRPLSNAANSFFNSQVILWLVALDLIDGLLKGHAEVTSYHVPAQYFVYLYLAFVSIFIGYRFATRSRLRAPFKLTLSAFMCFQGLIIAVGFAASMPRQWELANTVIVTLYWLYVCVSFSCGYFLWRCVGQLGIPAE